MSDGEKNSCTITCLSKLIEKKFQKRVPSECFPKEREEKRKRKERKEQKKRREREREKVKNKEQIEQKEQKKNKTQNNKMHSLWPASEVQSPPLPAVPCAVHVLACALYGGAKYLVFTNAASGLRGISQ